MTTTNSTSGSSNPPAPELQPQAPAESLIAAEPVAIARAISIAVREVPGVAGISPGIFGRVGTFGIGDVVPGVAVSMSDRAMSVEIHVIASLPIVTNLPELAERIRESVRQSLSELPAPPVERIDVAIDDLQDP